MSKRKVLIPLDGSEFSRRILQVVQDFFDPKDVSLSLFRVAPPPSVPADYGSARDVMVGGYPMSGSYEAYSAAMERGYSLLEQELENQRVELTEELRVDAERLRDLGYTVKIEIQFGDPAQRIIQVVHEQQIGLVAMATHGRSGFSRLVLGSVAERVLRGAAAPVLLLRPEGAAGLGTAASQLASALGHVSILRMAVATDGSTFGQRAVSLACELRQQLSADLTVLVTTSGRDGSAKAQEIMQETSALLCDDGAPPPTVPLVGFADEVLLNWLESNPLDLLVIGAFADRGSGGAQSVGPTAHRLVQDAPVSVLLNKGHRKTFQRILVCASVEDDLVVTVGAQLAEVMSAHLNLLHVVPPSAAPYLADAGGPIDVEAVFAQGTRLSNVLHDWEAKLGAHGYDRTSMILLAGSAPEVILQQTRDGEYDLIIVGSESSPGHFPGSIANTVVRFADQSVMVVRVRQR